MIDELLSLLNWVPDYATGIWLVITALVVFTLLGINKELGLKHRLFKIGVVLVVIIWLYPLYTQLYYPIELGFIGNLLTLMASWWYFKAVRKELPKLVKWLYPLLIWAILATIFTLLMLLQRYSV